MKLIDIIKNNKKTILSLVSICVLVVFMLKLQLDSRAIAIITIVVGYITNVFAGLSVLISTIPIIGPLIVKLFTIPIFWLLNATGYFTSAYAIKKGYGKNVVSHRLMTLALLIGIILGYILGHLVPVR